MAVFGLQAVKPNTAVSGATPLSGDADDDMAKPAWVELAPRYCRFLGTTRKDRSLL